MRILIDIGHPAHVHLFKNFAFEMLGKGHVLQFTTRKKEITVDLLTVYNFPFKVFGRHFKSTFGKLFGLIKYDLQMIQEIIHFKPDILLSHGSIYAAHAAYITKKKHISFEDTGNKEQVKLYKPFTNTILTSDKFDKDNYGNKQIRYKGFHEIAYLHPSLFLPEKEYINKFFLYKNQRFAVLRFVSWDASHDVGQKGLSLDEKYEIIQLLKPNYRILISSENKLPVDLQQYQIKANYEYVHHLLAFADIFIGEGSTMAIESAILGTPSVYINPITGQPLEELEHEYNILWGFRNSDGVIDKIEHIISDPDFKNKIKNRVSKLFENKINVTQFLIWFIENYPESILIMQNTPEFQNNFIEKGNLKYDTF